MSCCVSLIFVNLVLRRDAPSAGHDSPLADHDSHGQRRTYVLPSGRLKPLYRVAADSSQSCHIVIAHLSPVARSFLSAEERAAPSQHARAGICGKIQAYPNLHSW